MYHFYNKFGCSFLIGALVRQDETVSFIKSDSVAVLFQYPQSVGMFFPQGKLDQFCAYARGRKKTVHIQLFDLRSLYVDHSLHKDVVIDPDMFQTLRVLQIGKRDGKHLFILLVKTRISASLEASATTALLICPIFAPPLRLSAVSLCFYVAFLCLFAVFRHLSAVFRQVSVASVLYVQLRFLGVFIDKGFSWRHLRAH